MAIPLTINGATFEYPVNFDEDWGIQATGWAQAVTNGMLQRQGGNFPLTADANFGPNFGLLSAYFETRVTNPASSGLVRLAKSDTIDWRNNANSADNILTVNGSDELTYNGTVIGVATGVTSITGTANQVIASASTGSVTLSLPQDIATTSTPSFLGLTLSGPPANRAVILNGANTLAASATTSTELGFVSGVTSSIQTQINSVSTVANAALPETGGTMSGAIAMGSNKITGMANGTAPADAITLEQVSRLLIPASQLTSVTTTTTTSSTYTVTSLLINYTPTSASSRIKLTVTGCIETTNSAASPIFVTLKRGSTDIGPGSGLGFIQFGNPAVSTDQIGPMSITYIDSPATTSMIAYAVFIRNTDNATTVRFNPASQTAVMILEEIA